MFLTVEPVPFNRLEFPLAQAADHRHPLLSIAARNAVPAVSTIVEWLVRREPWCNYTQIVRTPFRGKRGGREMWRAFEVHLDAIESTLWDGEPMRDLNGPWPLGFCGGVLHYLGREPVLADTIILRPLMDCVLRTDVGLNGESEFLTEFSLQVVPATPIRRRA